MIATNILVSRESIIYNISDFPYFDDNDSQDMYLTNIPCSCRASIFGKSGSIHQLRSKEIKHSRFIDKICSNVNKNKVVANFN